GHDSAANHQFELEQSIGQLQAQLKGLSETVTRSVPASGSEIKALVETSVTELHADIEARIGALHQGLVATRTLLGATETEYNSLLDQARPGEVEILRQQIVALREQGSERERAERELDVELRTLRAAGVPALHEQLVRREETLRSREEAIAAREILKLELDELRQRNADLESARVRYEQYQAEFEGDARMRERNAELERDAEAIQENLDHMAYELTTARNKAINTAVILAAVRQSTERETARSRDLEQEVHSLKSKLGPLELDLQRLGGVESELRKEADERRQLQDELFEGRQQSLRQKGLELKMKLQTELTAQYALDHENLLQRCVRSEAQASGLEQRLERATTDLKASLEREHALSLRRVEHEQQVRTLTTTVRDLQADVQRLERRRDELDTQARQLAQNTDLRLTAAREEEDRYRDELRSKHAELEGLVQARQQESETYVQKNEDLKAWYDRERAERSEELARLDERIAEIRRMEHARLDP
ncbi:MAG: hypothetical protein ABIS27_11735, partial [Longimicrobiales bacterium]